MKKIGNEENIKVTAGEYYIIEVSEGTAARTVSFSKKGNSFAGAITISGRVSENTDWEEIPNGTIDLSENPIQQRNFFGAMGELKVNIDSVSVGDGQEMLVIISRD